MLMVNHLFDFEKETEFRVCRGHSAAMALAVRGVEGLLVSNHELEVECAAPGSGE